MDVCSTRRHALESWWEKQLLNHLLENKTKKFKSNKGKEIAKHICALVDKLEDEEYTVFNQSMIEEGSEDEDNKDF